MTARNYTANLRRAQAEGARVVCAMQPHLNRKMEYRPRVKGDPSPWVLADCAEEGYRFNGRECKAVAPNSDAPWALARLLRLNP